MKKISEFTDEELLGLLKLNNEAALREIFHRSWKKMLTVALNRLGSHDEAEECVQDAFYILWKNRAALVLTSTIEAYVAGTLRHIVFDAYRKRERNDKKLALLPKSGNEPVGEAADCLILHKELARKIERTVNDLPKTCQAVFRMSREEGLSRKEIAERRGITIKAVERQLTISLKAIRKMANE